MPEPRPLEERYAVDEETGCWNWLRNVNQRSGYGQIWVNGIKTLAHRHVYEQMVGPIPFGHVIDHLCRNTRCVNPAHLEAVRSAENCRRGRPGANRERIPLMLAEVGELVAGGMTKRSAFQLVADEHGVSEGCVRKAYYGERWQKEGNLVDWKAVAARIPRHSSLEVIAARIAAARQ
jgi:hypothetical protein